MAKGFHDRNPGGTVDPATRITLQPKTAVASALARGPQAGSVSPTADRASGFDLLPGPGEIRTSQNAIDDLKRRLHSFSLGQLAAGSVRQADDFANTVVAPIGIHGTEIGVADFRRGEAKGVANFLIDTANGLIALGQHVSPFGLKGVSPLAIPRLGTSGLSESLGAVHGQGQAEIGTVYVPGSQVPRLAGRTGQVLRLQDDVMGVTPRIPERVFGPRSHQVTRNAIEGSRRHNIAKERLSKNFPNASVQSERTLLNSDGTKAVDPLTGEGRRLDLIVIEGGSVIKAVEVTSLTARKGSQIQKEQRIIANGGHFVKNRNTGELLDISDVKIVLYRRR